MRISQSFLAIASIGVVITDAATQPTSFDGQARADARLYRRQYVSDTELVVILAVVLPLVTVILIGAIVAYKCLRQQELEIGQQPNPVRPRSIKQAANAGHDVAPDPVEKKRVVFVDMSALNSDSFGVFEVPQKQQVAEEGGLGSLVSGLNPLEFDVLNTNDVIDQQKLAADRLACCNPVASGEAV